MTANCFEARSAQYTLKVGETSGIDSLTPDPSPTGEGSSYYTLDGRKDNASAVCKGVVIVKGRKIIK